jgi:hypothetical protein
MPSRPMNSKRSKGRSTDHDFVPPTQYKLGSQKTKLPDLSPLELIPKFEAMDLIDTRSSCQIPIETDSSSPKALFSLFFSTSVVDLIVQCTNKNAEKARENPVASRAGNIRFHQSLNQRLWHPVTSNEILAYFGILIYMGVYREPHINTYWNIRPKKGPLHPQVRDAMGQTRWNQIHRYLHVWDPTSDQASQLKQNGRKVRPHEKVDNLAKLLVSSFQRYWKPSTNLSVDECIEGFTGRASDTVNIPIQ